MRLFIAGVNHFDPMGRKHVASWPCSLADGNGSPPSFIAVELDENLFKILRAQRAQYRECIHSLWPGVPETDLDQFELSLYRCRPASDSGCIRQATNQSGAADAGHTPRCRNHLPGALNPSLRRAP